MPPYTLLGSGVRDSFWSPLKGDIFMRKFTSLLLASFLLVSIVFVAGSQPVKASPNNSIRQERVIYKTKRGAKKVWYKGRWVASRSFHNGKKITKKVWYKGKWVTLKGARGTKRFFRKVKNAM